MALLGFLLIGIAPTFSNNVSRVCRLRIYHYFCVMKFRCFTYSLLSMLVLLCGCYTATESVPTIKEKDIPVHNPTAEELVMENNFAQRGCHTWSEGKAFISVEERLSPMLRPVGNIGLVESGLLGKTFVYRGYHVENTYGDKDIVYLLYECDGNCYSYYTGKSSQEIAEMNYLPLLPSLVDADDIALARSLFVGKELYILSDQWYDAQGELMSGRHHVPVTITAVEPGNSVLPLALLFTDDRGTQARVYISTKSSQKTQILSFDRLFSYENPRNAYPDIADEVWQAITEGRLLKGMTKAECRMAIGMPAETKKIGTYSGLKEQWLYNTGTYLFFSDGVLEEFRQ